MLESETLIEFGDDSLDATQKAVRSAAFVELLEGGQPVSVEKIAHRSEVAIEVVERFLETMADRGSAELGNGRLIGIAGLSVAPTRHKVVLPHGERWTWCALDAIGIVAALGSGTINSRTADGSFTLTLVRGVFQPEDLAIFVADGYGQVSSISRWCPLVDFFTDVAAADRWAEQHGTPGRGMPISLLAPLAARRWRAIIDDHVS